jgi:putative phage-type endonuclease
MNEEFHVFRKTGIGGSDSAAALGMSPWKSPLQLYLDKIGQSDPVVETDAMRFGNLLEPIVIAEYARRTGQVVLRDPEALRRRYAAEPHMIAHLDGLVETGNEPIVVEAKTARDDRGWGDPGTDDIPQAYLLQATHNMIVAGAKQCDVPVLIRGSDFRIYTVVWRPELVELVIAGEREFWEAVQRKEPPSPKTLAEINQRWRTSSAASIELPPNMADAVAELAVAREQITHYETIAEELEGDVKAAMQFFDTATVDGIVVATWKQAKPSMVFDVKAFKAAHPELVREFEVEKPGSRRFLLKTKG